MKAIQATVLPAQSQAHRTVIAARCAPAGVARAGKQHGTHEEQSDDRNAGDLVHELRHRQADGGHRTGIGQPGRCRAVAGAGPPSGDDDGRETRQEHAREH